MSAGFFAINCSHCYGRNTATFGGMMPRRVAAHSSISSLVCTSCTMNKVGSLCGLAGRLEMLKISGIVQRPLICPQRKKKDSTWAHNYPLNIYIHTEHELARILPIIAAAERSIVERSGSEIAVSDTLAHEIPSSGVFPEGVKRVVTVNAYERSTEARAACIAHYGLVCAVCGFDFEAPAPVLN